MPVRLPAVLLVGLLSVLSLPLSSFAQATGGSALFVDAMGNPAAEYLESSQAYVKVLSPFANGNPGAADTAQVRIQTALTGDTEFVTLTETGPDTGVFLGGILLRLGPSQPGDGLVQTLEDPGPPHRFDTLTATYDNPFGSATAEAALTGSRTTFVDVYGAAVTSYPVGSRVYLRVPSKTEVLGPVSVSVAVSESPVKRLCRATITVSALLASALDGWLNIRSRAVPPSSSSAVGMPASSMKSSWDCEANAWSFELV